MNLLKHKLDTIVAERSPKDVLANDPLGIVREHSNEEDQEVVALLAASLAFGNVVSIRRSIRKVLLVLGSSPKSALMNVDATTLRRRLGRFRHRVYRGSHVAALLLNARDVLREHGSLGMAMDAHMRRERGEFREALACFADELRGESADRAMRHLISDPRAGSACKRLLLFCRWMSRPDDGIDLGLWSLPTSELLMPLDTHVHRIARNLGMTDRNDASWRTAVEVTAALRAFDPTDPVKYDFALCHLGISGDCPSRRDPVICAECPLRADCREWRPSG
jgi:uncharacterized protein (TIGR02757 family)